MAQMLKKSGTDLADRHQFDCVSVHIPKCGGTTLVKMLNSGFRSQLFLDPDYFPKKYSILRNRRPWERLLRRTNFSNCVHGHFPASVHWHSGAFMFTTVRDPVERAVSNWRYIQRLAKDPKHGKKDFVKQGARKKLEDVANIRDRIFERFLDVPLDQFSMICSQIDLDQDLELLAGLLGCPPSRAPSNVAPTKAEIDPDFRKRFEATNPNELKIYYEALERRERILSNLRLNAGRVSAS